MAGSNTEFMKFITDKINENEGLLVPVKVSAFERRFVKSVPIDKLHPNPDDEFCFPDIGPSFEIIANYEKKFRRYGTMMPEIDDEPIMVEKVRPDGYLILNGHHRWIAAKRVGMKKVPVAIVNLTTSKDIQNMLRMSTHDKRVTLDLDEVIFATDKNEPMEKPLHFPYNKAYKERLRLGVPALLRYFGKKGYDVWVYSSNYYSVDYISELFEKYYVKVDGIVTGGAKKIKNKEKIAKKTKEMFEAKYTETIHIDRDYVTRTVRDTGEFVDYELEHKDIWSKEVIVYIKELLKK